MAMIRLIIIFALFCSITNTSLCGNFYDVHTEPLNPILKENSKASYTISATNESITISSLSVGSQISVFDSSGRNIYNKAAKSDFVIVPIRSKGIFIIRIKINKEIFTTKIFIK